MKHVASLLLLDSTALLTGCAGLMMSVRDKDGSNAEIALTKGDSVVVALPRIAGPAATRVVEASLSADQLATSIQEDMIAALAERGVRATAGISGENTLRITVTQFASGSGAARAMGFGVFGDSKLDGEAILATAAGTRELSIRKTGQQSGVSQAGDQTPANIDDFTSALASKLVD
jgi:hypothetical protein